MDFMALETILSSCNGLRASLLFRRVCLDVGRCPLFLNFFRFFSIVGVFSGTLLLASSMIAISISFWNVRIREFWKFLKNENCLSLSRVTGILENRSR